jgi:hypothetical protein
VRPARATLELEGLEVRDAARVIEAEKMILRARKGLVVVAAVAAAVAATSAIGAHALDQPGTIKVTDRLVKHVHVRGRT